MEKGSFPTTSLSYSYISDNKYSSILLPGRVRRRKHTSSHSSSSGKTQLNYFIKSLHRMIHNRFISRWKVQLAVLSWFILGCVSITTTKILLRDYDVQPIHLTGQQLFIGGCTLHIWISFLGGGGGGGGASSSSSSSTTTTYQGKWEDYFSYRQRQVTLAGKYLFFTAFCFALGFYTTNWSFFGSHASFVETIKAAEPITSASVAYIWGIEGLSKQEGLSLLGMCTGVVISTVGNALIASSSSSSTTVLVLSQERPPTALLFDSFLSTTIVLVSNLCFSFRGLFQKLLRSCPEGSIAAFNDIHLQLRIQQIGFLMFLGPIIFLDGRKLFYKFIFLLGLSESSSLKYVGLSIINGLAFTSYNLASTYVLSQLPVVQHAAINSLRRLFAIVVTSIIFSIPFTTISFIGIVASLLGFISYTHFKTKRLRQPRPLSSLLPLNAKD